MGASIQSISKNTTFEKKGRITLSCDAIGNPLPALSWIHNNTILASSITTSNETGQVERKFEIKYPAPNTIEMNLKIEKFAVGIHRFECIANNSHGDDRRSTFVESISDPTFSNPLNISFEIVEGHSITIECDVIAYPLPEIIWLKVCKSL